MYFYHSFWCSDCPRTVSVPSCWLLWVFLFLFFSFLDVSASFTEHFLTFLAQDLLGSFLLFVLQSWNLPNLWGALDLFSGEIKIWVLEWSLLLGYHSSNTLLVSEQGNICTYMFTLHLYLPANLFPSFHLPISLFVCLLEPWVHTDSPNSNLIRIRTNSNSNLIRFILYSSLFTFVIPFSSWLHYPDIVTYLITSPVCSQFHMTAASKSSWTLLSPCWGAALYQVTLCRSPSSFRLGCSMVRLGSRFLTACPPDTTWASALDLGPLNWTVGKAFKERLC